MFPELNSISQRRKRLGLTQKALADKAGISQSLLTKIERGVVVPNYKIACEIFEVLDEFEHSEEKVLSDIMLKRVITLKSNDRVFKAVKIAKKNSISQFPVVDGDKVVGAVTTNMLIGFQRDASIKSVMKEPFPTLNANTPVVIAKNLLRQYPAIVVLSRGSIVGIVTAEDML